jgi:trehalose 6-phosphate phosphatase
VNLPPSVFTCWPEIERHLAVRTPAFFLDYDGTLAPLAPRPELAVLPAATREVLRRLAARFPVAVLSGRAREDVAALVGLENLIYAGSPGFDIAGPSLRREAGEGLPTDILETIDRAAAFLAHALAGLPGVLVEPKRFALAVHFRLAAAADLPRIEREVDAAAALYPELRKTHGKKVFEFRPTLAWDKGQALLWLLEQFQIGQIGRIRPIRPIPLCPIFIGDDLTDEDAFRAVKSDRGQGLGILVAGEPRETAAEYSLCDPEQVREFLERFAESG